MTEKADLKTEKKKAAEAIQALYEVLMNYQEFEDALEHLDEVKEELIRLEFIDDDCYPKE